MESRYTSLIVNSNNYFTNKHLYRFIKNNYYSFRSCLYGELYISNIPSKSTYSISSINQKRIYEDTPTPNPYGYKMFSLSSKSNENLTVFINTKAWIKNNELKIKLNNYLFEKITRANTKKFHNIFILCETKVGAYFIHAGLINMHIPRKKVVKKILYKY